MSEKSLIKNGNITIQQQQQQYDPHKFYIDTTQVLNPIKTVEAVVLKKKSNFFKLNKNKRNKNKMDDSNATPLLGGTTKLSVESDDGSQSCVIPSILTSSNDCNSIGGGGGLKHNSSNILMNNSSNINLNSQLLSGIGSTNNGSATTPTTISTINCNNISNLNNNNNNNNNNNINNHNNSNCVNSIMSNNTATQNLLMNNTTGGGGVVGGGGIGTIVGNGSNVNLSNSNNNISGCNNSNSGNKLSTMIPTVPSTAATTTIVHFGPGGGIQPTTRTSLQRNYNGNTNTNPSSTRSSSSAAVVDSLLFKEPKLCKKLLILAIAFTIFGAAIGALSIYFAGGYRCLNSDSNINNGNAKLEQTVCLTEECVRTASSLLAAMDQNADPCVDFFQYACGTWNKKHLIPEDRGSISTFEVLADQLQVILKGVLEEYINDQDSQATIKAKMFYRSCMDIEQMRRTGDIPLKKVLKKLGGWPVIEKNWTVPNFTIEYLFGVLRGEYSEPVLIELYVSADDKNSSVNILQIDQLVLALPSRDYYLKDSSENDLKAYHRYMTQIAILLGADPKTAKEELNDVLQFEINLANVSMPEADRHDTSSIYKKVTLPELQAKIPELNWTDYLQSTLGPDIKLRNDEPIVSYAMPYLVQMGRILATTDRRIIHNYVLWRLVMSIMTHMIDDYERERVEFKKILVGIQSERVRWSQCVEWTNKKLGMAVGALFIRDNFNQESKETALEMIHTIRAAFNELLADIHWMDDETRAVAKEKADAMNERIGYPEILTNPVELEKEYVNLTIWEDHFMNNVLSILQWDAQRNLQLLRKPVDKDKWTTEPAVVNAFYNPNKNDIVFPAGILQPLFYSQHFPKSLNYGGIGVVIGHEITHGFDDKGRQFDKDGNMMQWWNNATIRAFRERAQCIIDQYSRYKIDEVGQYMNGRMTQGENIADNGGLKQAFRAFRKWVSKHGSEPDLPGLNLSHDQLFFLNYAQIWCGSMRPQDALTKIRSSVHSPGFVRVLGPLSNSVDFSKAYKCPLGSPMNPINKCSVW